MRSSLIDLPAAGRRLVAWYARHGRDLPFRRDPDPYRVWVSEIMLQQTTVATVGPYYTRFIGRFPTLQALAAAEEPEVLALWSGLGYYHRARNLLKAARLVRDHHDGEIPRELSALLSLPGIGAYTAGAIRSIGHNLPAAALDGNVLRVVARLAARAGDPARAATRRAIESLVLAMIPEGEASRFTQGLMDLGSGVCTPREPRCLLCPLSDDCLALRRGLTGRIPAPKRGADPVAVSLAAVVVRREGECLLTRREEGTLMRGLWEFPIAEPASRYAAEKLARRFGARLVGPVGEVRHTITRYRMKITIYEAKPTGTAPAPARWLPLAQIAAAGGSPLPLTGAARKIARRLPGPPA